MMMKKKKVSKDVYRTEFELVLNKTVNCIKKLKPIYINKDNF